MNKDYIAHVVRDILAIKKIDQIVNVLNLSLKLHRKLHGKVGYPIFNLGDSDKYFSQLQFTPLAFQSILDENSDNNSRLIEITWFEYNGVLLRERKKTEHEIDDQIIKTILEKLFCDISLKAEQEMSEHSKVEL